MQPVPLFRRSNLQPAQVVFLQTCLECNEDASL